MGVKKVKVIMFQKHIAYVNHELTLLFRTRLHIVNFTSWVQQQANACFGIALTGPNDLELLREAVEANFYDDIGDWLQDRMRHALQENNANSQ